MMSEIVLYLIGILALVGGILLVERLVAGPRSTAGTGYASVDSAFDYERMLRKHSRAGIARLVHRRNVRTLPLLPAAAGIRHFHDAGEHPHSRRRHRGVGGRRISAVRPELPAVSDRARARLGSVLLTMRRGEPLPPIEVWAWNGQYYVLDGHHRVAAARALGDDCIDALVTEVLESSRVDVRVACEACS